MPYLCIKTVSITPCNEDMSRVGKNSSYSSVVYIKKCLYLFVCVWYMYKVQNTKNTEMLGKGAQQNTED